jgi:S-DNA-T family DNA segregation ATPase FtsK/SpoIIIE
LTGGIRILQKDDKSSFSAMVAKEILLFLRSARASLRRTLRGTLWQAWQRRRQSQLCEAGAEQRMDEPATGVEAEHIHDEDDAAAACDSGTPAAPVDQSAVMDRLAHRFAAKLDARERRQQRLQRQRLRDEQQQALIDPRILPAKDDEKSVPEAQMADASEATAASAPPAAAAVPAPVLPPRHHGAGYALPPMDLLLAEHSAPVMGEADISAQRTLIQDCLDSFSIDADVGTAICGPRVTLYQVNVAPGVRVGMVSAIGKDLCMALSAQSLRILAPVPGHDYVGIEVPNRRAQLVRCGDILSGPAWQGAEGALPVIMGRNIQGEDIFLDLSKAPHLLVAGATGSGKSVCLNAILMSLLYRFKPDELQLLLVDPKVVEMNVFASLPHLVVPVITEVQLVVQALRWLINEMGRRYRVLAKVGVRNLESFNSRPPDKESILDDEGQPIPAKMPHIVLIIDELADIMLSCRTDVESGLARIAQMSRAVGIHSIVATQRPSVNVITGVIKANFPSRVAFQVSSQVDSRTIIDGKGAESLLGAGDMLFKPPSASRVQRLQGAMVTDAEIEAVVAFWAAQGSAAKSFELIQQAAPGLSSEEQELMTDSGEDNGGDGNDSLLRAAMEIVIRDHKASISYLQRRLRIGYNRAATLVDRLEKRGIIGPQLGTAPREILVESMESAIDDEDY